MYNAAVAQFTVSGLVRNDPDAGVVDGSASPFSMPKDELAVILVETAGGTVTNSAFVNKLTGGFSMTGVAPGTYYAMLITPDTPTPFGSAAPPSILETSWTFTGESVDPSGAADVLVDGKTNAFNISANFSDVQFGIQERPFANNKMNVLTDNTSATPVSLSVNTVPLFTQGGSAILSGADNGGGTIMDYSVTVLPKYGTLYLSGNAVTDLADVASITPAQFASLAYQPNPTALAQELDFFTYNVTDNAGTKSNNATYVLPFALLDGDTDVVVNRFDFDDDNDGITDVAECNLNDPAGGYSNLLTAYGTGQFSYLKPSDFDLTIAQRTGINLTKDISALFGKPTGSIIVTVSNANTHPTANEFYTNDQTGPSQWTISGTLGTYTVVTQGAQYFSYDTRTITLLNGTPMNFPAAQSQSDPGQTNWSSGNNGYSWFLMNDNAKTDPVSEGGLVLALINPEPKYFEVASTANNLDEWATYFVEILPECDDDNDGIPNRLDLDSDNDGCLDALEGGSVFEIADIVPSTGTVTVGPGSSAVGGNLCASSACVDANGIPTIAGASGQTPVETYNPAIISQVCQDALPVTLSAFSAGEIETGILLKWTTVSEEDNKAFEIQRSTNGKSWTNIGSVAPLTSNGSSNTVQHYSFIDNNPFNGQNYYRLKQVDLDNSFAYSTIRTVWAGKNLQKINLYPNPASSRLNIAGLKGGESVRIFDIMGRLVYQKEGVRPDFQVPISGLSEGLYSAQIFSKDGGIYVLKFILKK